MKRSSPFALLAVTGLLLTACAGNPTPSTDTTAPTVGLSAAPKTLTAAGTVTLTATASDNVGVTKVTFYRGTTEIGSDDSAPYTFSDSVTAAQNGTVTYSAIASDAAGNTATASDTVAVNIGGGGGGTTPPADTTAPTVSLTAAPKTVTAAGTVTLTASASDNVSVTSVTFYRGGTEISTDTTAPFSASDSVTAAQNGTVTYSALARDAAGNVATASDSVTVNIGGGGTTPPGDTTAPTVKVSIQPTTLTAPGTVTYTATASDNQGVTFVAFYDNGQLVSIDTSAPYSASRSYDFADNGVHEIRALAYDLQANVGGDSALLTVKIPDAGEPNDSVAEAKPLLIGTPFSGSIAGQPRDFDYFKFTAAAGDQLKLTVKSVSVNPASTLDPYVEILLPDGFTVLEKDDDSGAGLESEIRFNIVTGGTYYVALTSFKIHDDDQATDDRASNTYQIALTRR